MPSHSVSYPVVLIVNEVVLAVVEHPAPVIKCPRAESKGFQGEERGGCELVGGN